LLGLFIVVIVFVVVAAVVVVVDFYLLYSLHLFALPNLFRLDFFLFFE